MADEIIIDEKPIEPITVKPIIGEVISKVDDDTFVIKTTKIDLTSIKDKQTYLQTIIDSVVPSDKELLEWAKQNHPHYDEVLRANIELIEVNKELKRYD